MTGVRDTGSEGKRHKPLNGLLREEWRVETLALEQGRELVRRFHYAEGSANTATFRHGLFRAEDWPFYFVGAALWIPPTKTAAQATFPEDWQAVLSLSRLVIEPGVPTNAASFLIAASVRQIRRAPRWRCLVTYADEWQGHTGAIYLACGWEFMGETKPERIYVRDGVMVARKAGPKTRTHAEMLELGCECVGAFPRRKFRKVLS